MARTLDEARQIVNELSPEDKEILAIELGLEMKEVDPEVKKPGLQKPDVGGRNLKMVR